MRAETSSRRWKMSGCLRYSTYNYHDWETSSTSPLTRLQSLTSYLSSVSMSPISLCLRWTSSWSPWWRGRRRSGRSWWTGGRWCQRHWTSKAFVWLLIGPSAHRCNISNSPCARPLFKKKKRIYCLSFVLFSFNLYFNWLYCLLM